MTPDYKADAETVKSLGAALKAGAADLSPSHAIDAAWGLALLGGAEKEAVSALFAVATAAVQKDPTSVDVYQLGALYNAAVLVPGAKLPEPVRGRTQRKDGPIPCLRSDALFVQHSPCVMWMAPCRSRRLRSRCTTWAARARRSSAAAPAQLLCRTWARQWPPRSARGTAPRSPRRSRATLAALLMASPSTSRWIWTRARLRSSPSTPVTHRPHTQAW